jgi:hypothetical protein
MHHPLVNAEIARLAHADAVRLSRPVEPPPDDGDSRPDDAPWPLERLSTWLLPELPLALWSPDARAGGAD